MAELAVTLLLSFPHNQMVSKGRGKATYLSYTTTVMPPYWTHCSRNIIYHARKHLLWIYIIRRIRKFYSVPTASMFSRSPKNHTPKIKDTVTPRRAKTENFHIRVNKKLIHNVSTPHVRTNIMIRLYDFPMRSNTIRLLGVIIFFRTIFKSNLRRPPRIYPHSSTIKRALIGQQYTQR